MLLCYLECANHVPFIFLLGTVKLFFLKTESVISLLQMDSDFRLMLTLAEDTALYLPQMSNRSSGSTHPSSRFEYFSHPKQNLKTEIVTLNRKRRETHQNYKWFTNGLSSVTLETIDIKISMEAPPAEQIKIPRKARNLSQPKDKQGNVTQSTMH